MPASFATRLIVPDAASPESAGQAEQALAGLSGVEQARVDPATRLAIIRHDSTVTATELVAALERAGFSARHALPGEGSAAYASSPWGVLRPAGRTAAQEASRCQFLTIAGLVLIVGVLLMPALITRADHIRLLCFVLASVGQVMLGAHFYSGALEELLRRRPGTNLMIALASSACYLYGAAVTFELLRVPDEKFFHSKDTLLLFGTAPLILTVQAAGRCVELWLKHRAGSALRALIDMAPPTARVQRGDEERTMLSCDLAAGDVAVVGPGERFPADGIVTEGHSAVDESVLTGEALPVPKGPGDEVLGGTINGNGRLVFRVERSGSQAALAQMVRRLSDAAKAPPALAALGERMANFVVLGALLMAVAAFFVSYFDLLGSHSGRMGSRFTAEAINGALQRSVAILLVACPWGILAAVPGAYAAAVARAAREGIIFRSGRVLEACARLRAAVFLRSGILTLGRPELSRQLEASGADASGNLGLAASLADASGHPLARALREAAESHGAPLCSVSGAGYAPGLGSSGRDGAGRSVLLGRRMLLAQEGVDLGELAEQSAELEASGLTVRYLAVNGKCVATMAFSDPVRPGAGQVTASLSGMGVTSYMISGESPAAVQVLAGQSGVARENACANVHPGERLSRLRAIRERAGLTAAVGHGVKDAELLLASDIGVAIGGGTDAVSERTPISLIGCDLHGVRRVVCLARGMVHTAQANLTLAMAFPIIGLPLVAWLVPTYQVSPLEVAVAAVLTPLAVAVNSYYLARSSSDTSPGR